MRIPHKLISLLLILSTLISIIPFSGCAYITGEDTVDESNTFLELLSLLPASAQDRGGFLLIDYKKCFSESGISFNITNDTETSQHVFRQIFDTKMGQKHQAIVNPFGMGSFYTGFGMYIFMTPITQENTGYDFTYATAEIQDIYQSGLFDGWEEKDFFFEKQLVAAIGRYDANSTDQALQNQSEWTDQLKAQYVKENYLGVTIHSWGDWGETRKGSLGPPLKDLMGHAPPLAIVNGRLLVAYSVDDIKLMIDSIKNQRPSLANVKEYALVAKGLTELNTSIAVIANSYLVNVYNQDFMNDKGPFLTPFSTFGMGRGKDKKGDYVSVVIMNKNSIDAEENAVILRNRIDTTYTPYEGTPWSYRDHVYDLEIRVNSSLILAKLYVDDSELWYKWFAYRCNLLLQER